MPSLTISIDRTGMVGAPAPLVLVSNTADVASNTVLGCSGFREPAKRMRRRVAPPSDFLHGDVVLGFAYDQSLLVFDVLPFNATEAQAKTALVELEAAIARLQFEVTVTVGDADPLVYLCDAGEAVPVGDRSWVDLQYVRPKWSVEIPCYPIPTEAP
jgi:hypothetical protein